MPFTEPAISPREVVQAGLCIGCGACGARPGAGAEMAFDRYGQLKPSAHGPGFRTPDTALARTCPFSPWSANEDDLARALFPDASRQEAHIGRFTAAYVGHVNEQDFRVEGSSGGLVSWTAVELLKRGLADAVAHVAAVDDPAPGDRLFRYRISRSESAVRAAAKSRYYPVEISEVVAEIRARPGRYAFIGIPCFIKAIQLLRAEDPVLRERICFTLGLFCGHMKSARMVESFAWQVGESGEAVRGIDFRQKDPSRPANWYRARISLRGGREKQADWWDFADGDWGAGFFQNSACNFCDDVVAETADISFGDAWVEPYSSDGRGTNVIVTRSPVLTALLDAAVAEGRLALARVDADFVRETQAAGFRQRREGLALRLATCRRALKPRKRVRPVRPRLSPRRWAVYRMRTLISAWSHRVFFVARKLNWPAAYLTWARAVGSVYGGVAWSHGLLGRRLDHLEALAGRLRRRA